MKALELVAVCLCLMLSSGCVSEAVAAQAQPGPAPVMPMPVQLAKEPQEGQKSPVNEPFVQPSPEQEGDCEAWLPSGPAPAHETVPWTIYGQSMAPFIHDGQTIYVARAPAPEIRIGDVVCWSLSQEQKAAQENVNQSKLAAQMQTGLPVKVEISWWGAQYFGNICHQVVWRNATHFVTQGTNPSTNKYVDMMPPQSFSENYGKKAIFDEATQAQLFRFWQENRQTLRYNFEHGDGSWGWCQSEEA